MVCWYISNEKDQIKTWYQNLPWFVIGFNFYPQRFLFYFPFPRDRNRKTWYKLDLITSYEKSNIYPEGHLSSINIQDLFLPVFNFLSLIDIFQKTGENKVKNAAKFLFAVFRRRAANDAKAFSSRSMGLFSTNLIISFHCFPSFVFVAIGTWPSLCRLRPTGNKWSHFL